MTKESRIQKIRELALKSVNEKKERELKQIEQKINSEIDIVETVLKYIKNKLLFKIKPENYNGDFILVTEEMFFEDYNKTPKYSFENKLEIRHKRENNWDYFINVKGEKYYDIRYLIRNYEQEYNNAKNQIDRLYDNIRNISDTVDFLKRKELKVKKLIQEYEMIEIDEELTEVNNESK